METQTVERATIGGPVPGYYGTVRPLVRLESWGPAAERLHPLDWREEFIGGTTEEGEFRVYPDWSALPEWRVAPPMAAAFGYSLAVRVDITGRSIVRWGGSRWIRGRMEFCHDGEPSTFAPCWLLVE